MTVSRPKADTPLSNAPAAPSADVAPESFVINLCSSTTPMALTQPKLAQLKDFTFFVSRRLEDGRERFRLHMGYFDSLLQAEDLLAVVREVYPGAWAGEAPGKRLRARAATAASTTPQARPAVVAPTVVAKPAAVAPPAAPIAPAIALASAQRENKAAAPVAAPTPQPDIATLAANRALAMEEVPSAEILAMTPTLSAAPDDDEITGETQALKLELMPDLPAPAPESAPIAAAPARQPITPPPVSEIKSTKPAVQAAAQRERKLPFDQRSNVREVMKSLDESGLRIPKPKFPPEPAPRDPGVLPESRVMRLLEEKRGDPLGTMSTPAAFAVQLQWSVQQIDLARVPPLAIFGAYTLYTVEGSREGRRWFGLRLGFFKDAHSAKQVAQYVRSEFSSVAVVPVSLKERDGASGPGAANMMAAASKVTNRLPEVTGEFKLLEDVSALPKLVPVDAAEEGEDSPAELAAALQTSGAAEKAASPGRPSQRSGKGRRVHAHAKRTPKTLEETLEILGADQLQIEGARTKRPTPVQQQETKTQKNSFSRLLDKLAERSR